jgi:ABC-type molybdate transport system substrate-binding protein
MKHLNRITVALSLLLSVSSWAAELTVSAAASLTQAFQDIGSDSLKPNTPAPKSSSTSELQVH